MWGIQGSFLWGCRKHGKRQFFIFVTYRLWLVVYAYVTFAKCRYFVYPFYVLDAACSNNMLYQFSSLDRHRFVLLNDPHPGVMLERRRLERRRKVKVACNWRYNKGNLLYSVFMKIVFVNDDESRLQHGCICCLFLCKPTLLLLLSLL